MSTIKVTNLQATGETASRAVSGVAAFWVSFVGTGTASVSGSLNQSSFTDNGTGNYTHTFVSAFSAGNYCFQLACKDGATAGRGRHCAPQAASTYSTTAFQSEFQNDDSNAMQDVDDGSVSAHGDLA